MLTVEARFVAIVAVVAPVAKMEPYQEPAPKESAPDEHADQPEEKQAKEEKYRGVLFSG